MLMGVTSVPDEGRIKFLPHMERRWSEAGKDTGRQNVDLEFTLYSIFMNFCPHQLPFQPPVTGLASVEGGLMLGQPQNISRWLKKVVLGKGLPKIKGLPLQS
ncbi:hypothetical protein KIL84_005075 [Mauremys mutica]|uniref:Uncharacterized protein n=1 Tax=Mauremys mutica TaxID=74926 RepID=A0A9D4B5R1_9SAUR|nr:hypothetical protein KIL84_005075 [Mauremys mutica]